LPTINTLFYFYLFDDVAYYLPLKIEKCLTFQQLIANPKLKLLG